MLPNYLTNIECNNMGQLIEYSTLSCSLASYERDDEEASFVVLFTISNVKLFDWSGRPMIRPRF